MKESISVEIFRDVTSPDVDVQLAHEGIAVVNAFAKNLEIVRDTRRMSLGGDALAPVSKKIRFPNFENDLAIVLTGRLLGTSEDGLENMHEGFAVHMSELGKAIAVVNVNGSDPITTTAHETGHMLGLSYPRGADEDHCASMMCIMYPSITTSWIVSRVKERGIKGALEWIGYRAPEFIERNITMANEFCSDCQEQLARRAFALLQGKQDGEV